MAGLLTELAEPAALLTELNALSTTEVREIEKVELTWPGMHAGLVAELNALSTTEVRRLKQRCESNKGSWCAGAVGCDGTFQPAGDPCRFITHFFQIDELDYAQRMAAYSRLTPATWQPLNMRQAAPLLHTCLHDLRNAGGWSGWAL